MKTSDFIKEKMEELGLTQNGFGRKCGISQGTVHNILNDGAIREDTLVKIARTFGRHPGSFIEWEGPALAGNIEEESPGFGINSEEQKLLDVFRGSKTAKLAIRELLGMTEDQRLQTTRRESLALWAGMVGGMMNILA